MILLTRVSRVYSQAALAPPDGPPGIPGSYADFFEYATSCRISGRPRMGARERSVPLGRSTASGAPPVGQSATWRFGGDRVSAGHGRESNTQGRPGLGSAGLRAMKSSCSLPGLSTSCRMLAGALELNTLKSVGSARRCGVGAPRLRFEHFRALVTDAMRQLGRAGGAE